MHGVDRAGGVALQRLDLLGDLLGGVLGLHRQRLDLGGDHGKAAAGLPARAASMVELSASSVVCRAICAIRLTTLPIAAENSRKRSTLALASRAASLAWSASLPASRTCAPMPCAEWVNLSAACENVVAVVCAAVVRPVKASVRWRMVESVAAVASAPPATELAARSSWRIMPPSSSSKSSRISLAESPSAGGVGCDDRRRNLGFDARRGRFRHSLSKQTERHVVS